MRGRVLCSNLVKMGETLKASFDTDSGSKWCGESVYLWMSGDRLHGLIRGVTPVSIAANQDLETTDDEEGNPHAFVVNAETFFSLVKLLANDVIDLNGGLDPEAKDRAGNPVAWLILKTGQSNTTRFKAGWVDRDLLPIADLGKEVTTCVIPDPSALKEAKWLSSSTTTSVTIDDTRVFVFDTDTYNIVARSFPHRGRLYPEAATVTVSAKQWRKVKPRLIKDVPVVFTLFENGMTIAQGNNVMTLGAIEAPCSYQKAQKFIQHDPSLLVEVEAHQFREMLSAVCHGATDEYYTVTIEAAGGQLTMTTKSEERGDVSRSIPCKGGLTFKLTVGGRPMKVLKAALPAYKTPQAPKPTRRNRNPVTPPAEIIKIGLLPTGGAFMIVTPNETFIHSAKIVSQEVLPVQNVDAVDDEIVRLESAWDSLTHAQKAQMMESIWARLDPARRIEVRKKVEVATA